MKNFLLYVWQLPQNLIGLLVIFFTKAVRKPSAVNGVDEFYFATNTDTEKTWGVSLGKYIIFNYMPSIVNQRHEYGHKVQSQKLGWFYLIVIGLPSFLHNLKYRHDRNCNYYHFYTESWADNIGDIKR